MAELPVGDEQTQTPPFAQSSSVKHSSALQAPCKHLPGTPASVVHGSSPVHGVPVRRYGEKTMAAAGVRPHACAVLRCSGGTSVDGAGALLPQARSWLHSGAPFVTELSLHPTSATAQTNAISRPNLGASICRIGALGTLN